MALFKPKTWQISRFRKDIINYRDWIRTLKRERNDRNSKFNKWKLQYNSFYNIYFTHTVPDEEAQERSCHSGDRGVHGGRIRCEDRNEAQDDGRESEDQRRDRVLSRSNCLQESRHQYYREHQIGKFPPRTVVRRHSIGQDDDREGN